MTRRIESDFIARIIESYTNYRELHELQRITQITRILKSYTNYRELHELFYRNPTKNNYNKKTTDMAEILFKDESYQIVGICMEIHKALGMGLKEINYKDAMELEFQTNNIPYEREKKYKVFYKGKVLSHPYVADFLVFNAFILEIKSAQAINQAHIAQTLSYLNVSSTKLGIIINFGEKSLKFQRIVL